MNFCVLKFFRVFTSLGTSLLCIMGELIEGGCTAMAVGVSDRWYATCDTWHVTCDMWYVTFNTWHGTCDIFLPPFCLFISAFCQPKLAIGLPSFHPLWEKYEIGISHLPPFSEIIFCHTPYSHTPYMLASCGAQSYKTIKSTPKFVASPICPPTLRFCQNKI